MKLSFDLENIKYLKMDYNAGESLKTIKLALHDKTETYFIAALPKEDYIQLTVPQNVYIHFVSTDGIYKTEVSLQEIEFDEKYAYYKFKNPASLDYYQNREYYRILAEYDCIYTVEHDGEVISYNAVTYDLSPGGVSILIDNNAISSEESNIVICLPFKDIKSHLRFIRCEVHEDRYKLSFEFTDLNRNDYDILSDLCVKKQLD